MTCSSLFTFELRLDLWLKRGFPNAFLFCMYELF
jgi:hypothetical protein